MSRNFEEVKEEFRHYKDVKLPQRADDGSAGYDFYAPFDFEIKPKQFTTFYTDVKAEMGKDEVLMIYIRSSVGIKKHIAITNGTGVIDSSFYGNEENDGNISMALYNFGNESVEFKKGDRIAQGVFVKYLTTDNDSPRSNIRIGGIGSSGKN